MSLLTDELLFGNLQASMEPVTTKPIQPVQSAQTAQPTQTEQKGTNKKPASSSIIITIITGIFLLILAVSGNFVAETMSCQSQKVLSENMFVKHAVIILITYFSLGFASGENNIDPSELFKQAIYIWIFFLMFNKMELFFTGVVVAMLTTLLICKNYISYYEKDNADKNKQIIDTLTRVSDYLFNGVLITTVIGFGLYFKKQHTDYYNDFSYTKFMFGSPKCANL